MTGDDGYPPTSIVRCRSPLAPRFLRRYHPEQVPAAGVPSSEAAVCPEGGDPAGFGDVVDKLRGVAAVRLMIKKRGRNLRAGQADQWTKQWFNGHGLHRLRGTIRYPKAV